MNYVKHLSFEDNPDYKYLKNLFLTLQTEREFNASACDWEELPEYRMKKKKKTTLI